MLKDKFIDLQELKIELHDMCQLASNLNTHFPLLSQKLAYIFSKIKECQTIQEADSYFEFLETIKDGLASLLYEYHIGMPDRLIRFVHDFDTLEPIYKEYYFKKIISGEYSF